MRPLAAGDRFVLRDQLAAEAPATVGAADLGGYVELGSGIAGRAHRGGDTVAAIAELEVPAELAAAEL